jgi:hypothetical protein
MVYLEDAPRDPFRDLRDDGVAETAQAVHPSGYPMSHSTHVGFNAPPVAKPSPLVKDAPLRL